MLGRVCAFVCAFRGYQGSLLTCGARPVRFTIALSVAGNGMQWCEKSAELRGHGARFATICQSIGGACVCVHRGRKKRKRLPTENLYWRVVPGRSMDRRSVESFAWMCIGFFPPCTHHAAIRSKWIALWIEFCNVRRFPAENLGACCDEIAWGWKIFSNTGSMVLMGRCEVAWSC